MKCQVYSFDRSDIITSCYIHTLKSVISDVKAKTDCNASSCFAYSFQKITIKNHGKCHK